MEAIKFIGLLCAVWLFVTGASIIEFIKLFVGLSNNSEPKRVWMQLLQKLINCSMCVGFWTGIIFYQNFYIACILSLSAEAFERLIDKIGYGTQP